jgi:3-oxosteroid 1-dehydrogenase
MVTSARTLPALGAALGIDGDQLAATADSFNAHAVHGQDPAFGRGSIEFIRRFSGDPAHGPNPLLGPITEAPFHGMRLRLLGVGIGSSGVRTDGSGHVVDAQGSVVPNLYAVGSCAATTTFGSGYNSGFALSRGLTLAHLVADELGALP